MKPRREDSWMFHRPAVELTRLQAEALGMPILLRETSGEKGAELADLEEALREARDAYGVYGVVTGALLSDYQRMNINIVAHGLGLKVYSPLWRKDQEDYMRRLVRHGFRFIVTSIDAYGLGGRFLGRVVDEKMVEEIISRSRRYGFNPAFEGGEAETLVLDAPLFAKRLVVRGRPLRVGEYSWRFVIEEARLVDKGVGDGDTAE